MDNANKPLIKPFSQLQYRVASHLPTVITMPSYVGNCTPPSSLESFALLHNLGLIVPPYYGFGVKHVHKHSFETVFLCCLFAIICVQCQNGLYKNCRKITGKKLNMNKTSKVKEFRIFYSKFLAVIRSTCLSVFLPIGMLCVAFCGNNYRFSELPQLHLFDHLIVLNHRNAVRLVDGHLWG